MMQVVDMNQNNLKFDNTYRAYLFSIADPER